MQKLGNTSEALHHWWEVKALEKDSGTACASCYAFTGNFRFKNVQEPLENNLIGWQTDRVEWVRIMTLLIEVESNLYFRWFHSGDLQAVEMLEDIVQVAKNLPNVKFWLPTQERGMVKKWIEKNRDFPANLCVRLSSPLVDVPCQPIGDGTSTSMVGKETTVGFHCEARKHDGACHTCRACWNTGVKNVTYPLKVGRFYVGDKKE